MKRTTLLLMITLPLLAVAQTSMVSGRITSNQNTPLEFANVFLLKEDSTLFKGTYADAEGSYRLESVPYGVYLLGASMVGYEKRVTDRLNIQSSEYAYDVKLREGTTLDEVVIASVKPLFEKKADRTVINVENSIVNAGGDAWEILQKAPGIEVDNNDQISILGKQGTIVMIDGRRTFLTGEQLANLLKGTSSSNIEKIEVITNPSAKYDASGNAGVINIVSKKNIITGFNSSLSLNTGTGWNTFYNPAGNFNYRTEKFNLYGNYGYADRDVSREVGLTRRIFNESQQVIFNQRNDIVTSSNEHLATLGFDLFVNKHNTIGVIVKGFSNLDAESGLSISDIVDVANEDQRLQVFSASDGNLENYSVNLNYVGKLNADGSSISLDFNRLAYEIGDDEYYDVDFNRKSDASLIREQDLRNFENSDIEIFTAQADYILPLSKNNLEIGLKYSDVKTGNDLQFDSLDQHNWIRDASRSNTFEYDESVYAAYVSYATSLSKINVQGGVRVEHTESVGNSVTLNQKTKRIYTDFFPSLSMSYPIDKNQRFNFSYSRRIDRPRYQWLNPFIFFFDPFTFYQGNPLLRPQYTNNLELSYSKNSTTFSAGFTETRDAMSFVTIQVDSTLTGTATNVNLHKLFNYNLSINTQKQLTDWWSVFTFFSGFYNYYDAQFEGSDVGVDRLSYRINLNNSISLPWSLKGEVSAFYQSPVVFGISVIDPYYVMNMGLQRKFLEGSLNARAVFNDVFNTTLRTGNTTHENQNLDFFFRRMRSRVVLSLSYSLGKRNISTRMRKSTARTEDSRVVTDGQ